MHLLLLHALAGVLGMVRLHSSAPATIASRAPRVVCTTYPARRSPDLCTAHTFTTRPRVFVHDDAGLITIVTFWQHTVFMQILWPNNAPHTQTHTHTPTSVRYYIHVDTIILSIPHREQFRQSWPAGCGCRCVYTAKTFGNKTIYIMYMFHTHTNQVLQILVLDAHTCTHTHIHTLTPVVAVIFLLCAPLPPLKDNLNFQLIALRRERVHI